MKKYLILIAVLGLMLANSALATSFPTSLSSWVRGQTITSDWLNSIEGTIGITSSASTTSLTYKVNHLLTSGFNSIFGTATTTTLISPTISGVVSINKATTSSSITQSATTFSGTPTWAGTPTNDTDLATKYYADHLVISGAPKSSTTTLGISRVSVNPASSTDPVSFGANDTAVFTGTNVGTDSTSTVQFYSNTTGYLTVPTSGQQRVTIWARLDVTTDSSGCGSQGCGASIAVGNNGTASSTVGTILTFKDSSGANSVWPINMMYSTTTSASTTSIGFIGATQGGTTAVATGGYLINVLVMPK